MCIFGTFLFLFFFLIYTIKWYISSSCVEQEHVFRGEEFVRDPVDLPPCVILRDMWGLYSVSSTTGRSAIPRLTTGNRSTPDTSAFFQLRGDARCSVPSFLIFSKAYAWF